MAQSRSYPANGLSMLPSIYPRDILHVTRVVSASSLAPGALVAYPSAGRRVVCHRVLRVQWRERELWLEVRGDAHTCSEWMPARAVLFTVTRVDGRLGSWRVDGPRGRLWSWLALSEARLARRARLGAASALRSVARLRQRVTK